MGKLTGTLIGLIALNASLGHGRVLEDLEQLDSAKESYDFVIVGGGIGGSTVASRLSENPRFNVLLIEAGPTNEGVIDIAVPGFFRNISSTYSWGYVTTPQIGLNNRSFPYNQARVLGGCSSHTKLQALEHDDGFIADAPPKLQFIEWDEWDEWDDEPITDASAKLVMKHDDELIQVTDASAKLQVLEHDDEFIVVSSDELQPFLQGVLWQRLERRILDENSLCHGIRVFTPCLSFVMNSECRRVNCPRHHVDYQDLTQDWFNCQVRIHLLQILIYHVYLGIPTPKDRDRTIQERRYWIHRLHETLRPATHYLGSEASVCQAGSKIPEAVLGSQTVVKWIRDILGNRELRFDRMLLTFLHEGASLLMRFDPNARNDLMRAPLLGVFAKVLYFRRLKGTVYVVPELYHCLRAADHSFISAGIVFFQHIVEKRINIDINVLCHLAEFLAGSVILARVRFNLHYVVLPRGWILALLRQIVMREPDTILLDRLLFSMKALLEGLVKGGEEANVGRCVLSAITFLIGTSATIFSRCCKFCRRPGFITHSNDLLQLDIGEACSEPSRPPAKPSPEGIRRVFFKNLQDVPLVLSTGALRPQAEEFIPSALKPQVTKVGGGDNSAEGQGGEAATELEQQPEADVTDLVDSRNIVDSLASTAAPLAVDHISQEQRDVALRLLGKHRQRVKNQELEEKKTPTQKVCDSYFETCLKLALDAKKMGWPRKLYYRKLYLGLVPHLLACIKGVESYAFSAKAEAKKRYRGNEQRDYDEMHKTTNEIVAIIKGCGKLGPRLDPSSGGVHKRQDVEGLKQLVHEVEELVNRVPSDAGLDVHFNLELAIKGITTPSKPSKAGEAGVKHK
ncbi:hypothetical protein EST38_g11097 [Candolleomyces aberdarensis]|uniref:Uncharacterized protein n=1 Tax=Candolleomyces aberdarensis TaxID=2316362 RepID=A0A4Q2D6E1_9AGAR|nr:hypothetical protein EST38_g11097 [Candolleomyces aberdarensis]